MKKEIFDEIVNNNLEDRLAHVIEQSKNYLDQIIIDDQTEDSEFNTVQSLLNLKSFLETSLFEYKTKLLLNGKLEQAKKKKLELEKEEKSSTKKKENLEQDQKA